jgi:hypothetical protein
MLLLLRKVALDRSCLTETIALPDNATEQLSRMPADLENL